MLEACISPRMMVAANVSQLLVLLKAEENRYLYCPGLESRRGLWKYFVVVGRWRGRRDRRGSAIISHLPRVPCPRL